MHCVYGRVQFTSFQTALVVFKFIRVVVVDLLNASMFCSFVFFLLFQTALFKFIRVAGDLLPAPLFLPYIHMLTGLATGPQSAHYCYSLLRINGKTFESSIPA